MRNITESQPILLGQLQDSDPELNVQWDEVRGVASSIRGRLTAPPAVEPTNLRAFAEPNIQAFLETYGELLGPPNITRSLRLLRSRTDDLGWVHLEFQQYYYLDGEQPTARELIQDDAIEVYGSKLAAHFKSDGTLIEVQSSCWRDIRVDEDIRINPQQLRIVLLERLEQVQGFSELRTRLEEREENFPLTDPPRLVVYPWQNAFRLAWLSYGYGVYNRDSRGEPTEIPNITYGQLVVDATTGEEILFAPTLHTAETADTGSGLAVTPLGGPHTVRALNIVRVDTTSTYRLKDTTHNRDIVTYDVACSTSYDSNSEIGTAITNGTLPVSEDTDGDKNWNRLPSATVSRSDGQQPEVDAHYFAQQQYEWYDAISGGRDGWDDGQYPNPPVPPLTITIRAHCRWPGGLCTDINAYHWSRKSGGVWTYWLAFMDGNGTTYDYPAGSHFIFAHEYQHAITNCSFIDGANNPGLTYSGWLGAVHEGLSDTFGGLSTEQWRFGTDISPATPGHILRNLAYPRHSAYWGSHLDHFDDRNTTVDFYERGTILAHCAYLMGQGGVHQRTARTPELIPVYSMGRQTVGGKNVLKAARIWYRALTNYFSNIGTATGIPTNDEDTFRTLRTGCVSAAEDIYGAGTLEHKTTILAFYAVGLHPVGTNYGADATFLRWGHSWQMSRPYIGITTPTWSSVDLFINNGGTSEWNALINVTDSMGNPTQYENTVYCRVRNIGDQDALNVQVTFSYAKIGTPSTTWQDVEDKDGNTQVLNVGTLTAGQSNFPDSAQNSPPASASVKWYIPPLAPGETVHHFCLKAVVTSDNDVNTYNNEVQSNIAYAAYTPGTPFKLPFIVTNPLDEEIALELKVRGSLPRRWKARIMEDTQGIYLKPREERLLNLMIDMPPGEDQQLEPPFDGEVRGKVFGSLSGPFIGTLTETNWDGERLKGRLAVNLDEIGSFIGNFEGTLDVKTWQIKGRATGDFQDAGTGNTSQLSLGIEACLRPLRRIDISQLVNGQPTNGTTVQVQVSIPDNPYDWKLPPTDTYVVPEAVG